MVIVDEKFTFLMKYFSKNDSSLLTITCLKELHGCVMANVCI